MVPELLVDIYDWITTDGLYKCNIGKVSPNQIEEENYYHKIRDLKYCIPVTCIILLLKLAFREFLFLPLARAYGIKIHNVKDLEQNRLLEKVYSKDKNQLNDHSLIKSLALQLKWEEREVERWFHKRERINKGGKFKRLNESGCRFLFGVIILSYLVYVIRKKTFNTIWWFQATELSFHLSLLITHFFDVKRKDSMIMFVHHILTISATLFAILFNLIRTSSLFFLCADVTDIALELSKTLHYLKMTIPSKVCFVIFVLTWFVFRLAIQGFFLVPAFTMNCFVKKSHIPFPCYVLAFIIVIMTLFQLIWTWMILQALHRIFIIKEAKDIRSDSETSEEESSKKTN